jgi:uncharacterized protein
MLRYVEAFESLIKIIEERQEPLRYLCLKHRVRRLELFGSAAGQGFNPESSDLDFLVEFHELQDNEYADAYFGLLEDLKALFRREVDLVVDSAVKNPYLRQSINRSRKLLYAA